MATVGSPLLSRENRPSEEDPESSADEKLPPRNQSILKTKALEAWRFTVASGALAGTLILLVNIITLAVMYGIHSPVDYSITFFTGSCLKARNTSVGAHVVINVLGTILLACSNFSMQCLGSPTRKEVDSAHSKRHWLNIGTPPFATSSSSRNGRRVCGFFWEQVHFHCI